MNHIILGIRQGWRAYAAFRPFSDSEAWFMFRAAAIAEAVGWTCLIIGIYSKNYLLDGNNVPVAVSGRIHGTLFIVYIAACLVLWPSLRWSFWRALVAGLASTPPYGSLLIEQWEARRRLAQSGYLQLQIVLYHRLVSHAS